MTEEEILEAARNLIGAWSTDYEDLVNDIEDAGFETEADGDFIEATAWNDEIDDDYIITFTVTRNGDSFVITSMEEE